MKRESFIFYESFYSAISTLPEDEQLLLFKAVIERALFGTETALKGCAKGMYDLIIPQIVANERRYINGCKGGRPQTKTKPKHNQNETKAKPNDNVNDNDNVNVNDNISLSTSAKIDYGAIVSAYNSICTSLPKVKSLTAARKKAIKSALETAGGTESLRQLFEKVETSDFLCGRTENAWTGCGFDWILKKGNLIKILEGNYNNQSKPKGKTNKPDYYDTSRYEDLNFN